MASTAHSLSVRLWLGIEVVVFAAAAGDIVVVSAYNLAALALRELPVVDPDLLLVALAEVAFVHISLVVTHLVV